MLYANACGTPSSFYSGGALDTWTCVPRKIWIPRIFPESQSDYCSLPPICQLFPSHSSPKSKERMYIKNSGRCSGEAEGPASICPSFLYSALGFPGGPVIKKLPIVQEMQERWVWSLGQEDLLEKEMATHSSILVWRTPWTEEPGGLQSRGSQRVRHDWARSHTCLYSVLVTHWPCQMQGERTSGSSLGPMRCFSTSKHYFRKNYLFYIGIELICNIVLVSGI